MKVFITGGSKGIGRAVALQLVDAGFQVAVCGQRDEDALREMEKFGCLSLLGDVGDYKQAAAMFDEILDKFGTIDLLVNNAARSHVGYFADSNPQIWGELINANLQGVLNCSHLAVRQMLAQGGGNASIVNISSIWGDVGASCEVVYSATKGGVNAFTKALAREVGPAGIRVNAISPGVVDTSMNNFLDKAEAEALKSQIPLGRFAAPSEIADCIEFLINNKYINGQIITIDGGLT